VGFGNNGLAKANLHGANDQKVLAGGDRESVGAGFTDSGKSKKIKDVMPAAVGLQTGDNSKFVRYWYEVDFDKIGFEVDSADDTADLRFKWYPYNKGGDFRKWYGNQDFVVNWENNGEEIRNFKDGNGSLRSRPQNTKNYFKPSISWSDVTSGDVSFRYYDKGFIYDVTGMSAQSESKELMKKVLALCNSCVISWVVKSLNPTLHFQAGNYHSLPYIDAAVHGVSSDLVDQCINLSLKDGVAYETSFSFKYNPLLENSEQGAFLNYFEWRKECSQVAEKLRDLEILNNKYFLSKYSLEKEVEPEVSYNKISLNGNPHYRYGGNRSEEELETLLQCDTLKELVSYAIGCMMGRYSLDKPGLILASQGEAVRDYLAHIPEPSFAPDDNAIIPLTDQEWFPDDATNRFRNFVRTAWGDEHLQENLDFVAESLCLHAIKPKKGEAALETIRRYLSTQFFKDHLRTYKKRPIYWLFSSGKQKAFECLVYLHRYNESTLAEMRTDYVIPLTTKLASYVEKLEQDKDASTSAAEAKAIEKELSKLYKQQTELNTFDEKLRHYADQRISLDLDDGVKVNYGKFGDLLAEVKQVVGKSRSE